jgi:hypothetical protein
MRRQLRWVVAAAAMAVLVPLAPAARAERQPGGGCSGSLTRALVGDMALATYEFVVDKVTYPTVDAWAAFIDQAVDLNRDGLVCYKVGKHPNHGHFDAHRITHIDNTFRP